MVAMIIYRNVSKDVCVICFWDFVLSQLTVHQITRYNAMDLSVSDSLEADVGGE